MDEVFTRVGRRGVVLIMGVETNCSAEVAAMLEEELGEEALLSLEFKSERPVKVVVVVM